MNSPVDVVRAFYEALGRGDGPAVLALLDPDVAWTEAERFPYFSGTWRGPQAVLDNLLIPLARDWDNFAATPREFIAQNDRIVTIGTYTGVHRGSGRSLTADFAHVWAVRGDRIVSFDMHTDTAKVLEATGV
jgi:ketosteroid isomerase-like protein